MKVRAGGIEMNYELSGEGNCLVLIHGFSDNLTMWYNQVPVFSRQYRVLTYCSLLMSGLGRLQS